MRLIYSLFITLYGFVAKLLALKSSKIKLFIDGRAQWRTHAIAMRNARINNEDVVWVHCASLGEFEQGRPVIERIKQVQPKLKILLTFYSPSGYEHKKNYQGADIVMYLPLDTISNAKDFIAIFKPKLALFVKYEFWYNYIDQLNKAHIPIVYFSVIFQPRHIYFKWYGVFFRAMLKKINYFFVQNEESKKLLSTIGIRNVSIAGDTRFDGSWEKAKTLFDDTVINAFVGNKKIIVVGSSWREDEQLLRQVLKYLSNEWALILAPHEIDDVHISSIMQLYSNYNPIKYTSAQGLDILKDSRVLIIDTIGILSYIYRYADVVWIGGGFNSSGIHNTVEAAVYGKPILIGPNYSKFQEARDLIQLGAIKSYSATSQSVKFITQLIQNTNALGTMGANAFKYVQNQLGATPTIVDYVVLKYLSSNP